MDKYIHFYYLKRGKKEIGLHILKKQKIKKKEILPNKLLKENVKIILLIKIKDYAKKQ